jgi:pimeloyl-ACP methyl ester carboxylesterase
MSLWDKTYREAFPNHTQSQVVALDPVDLEVVSLGSGEPPLMLLHGYTGSVLDWADVIGPLAADRRVLAYDHRGHGGSSHLAGGEPEYTFDGLVADLEALVEALELPPFHLLGHSMGGVVAMRFALAHPNKLASLVLMDTAASTQGGMPIEIVEGLAEIDRTAGRQAMVDAIAAFVPPTTDVLRDRGLVKLHALDIEAFVGFARELDRYPSMLTELAALDLPTTVICGADDPLITACTQLAETIPRATLELVEEAGHSPQEDQPQAWLAAVARHFTRLH